MNKHAEGRSALARSIGLRARLSAFTACVVALVAVSNGARHAQSGSVTLVDTWTNVNYPTGLAVDAAGYLHVFEATTGFLIKMNSQGQVVDSFNLGVVLAPWLWVSDVSFDESGDFYVTSGWWNTSAPKAHRFDSAGNLITSYPNPTYPFGPGAIVRAPGGGNVFITDAYGQDIASSIVEYTANGTLVGRWSPVAPLNPDIQVSGMCVANDGTLYVTEERVNLGVYKLAGGNVLAGPWTPDRTCAYGIDTDGESVLFVGDFCDNVIEIFSLATGQVLDTVPANFPWGVAYDNNRCRLYVSDSEVVRVFSVSGYGIRPYSITSVTRAVPPPGTTWLRTRTKLGVGEVVDLALDPTPPMGAQVVWTLEGPGSLAQTGNAAQFIAPSNQATSTIHATVDGFQSCEKDFDTVEPAYMTADLLLAASTSNETYIGGTAFFEVVVHPTDVSFVNAYVNEVGRAPDDVSGVFFDFAWSCLGVSPYTFWYHQGGGWVRLDEGNILKDKVGFRFPLPLTPSFSFCNGISREPGYVDYSVPFEWRVGLAGQANPFGMGSMHYDVLDSVGTVLLGKDFGTGLVESPPLSPLLIKSLPQPGAGGIRK